MAKYVCSVCGYIYEEAKGNPPEIAAGTLWSDLPDDWVCPLCGATKEEFENEDQPASQVKRPVEVIEMPEDIKELSTLEMSILCSNLARGCEKQYKLEEAQDFRKLEDYFKEVSPPAKEANFEKLLSLIEKDLEEGIPATNAAAVDDRGALRALVWGEKVTRILKSLLTRYEKEGDSMIENTGVYVCTICGFIYIGDDLPDICPVCKVPNWKFEKIEGGNGND